MPEGRVVFGAAVGVDGVDATIIVAVRNGPHTIVKIVNDGHAAGDWWVLDRLKALTTKYGAPAIIDRVGPSSALYDAASRAGIQPTRPRFIQGHRGMLQHAQRHQGPQRADMATRPPRRPRQGRRTRYRRWISDGAWVFGRRASVGSISALEAANLAAWGVDHLPAERAFQLG